MRSQSIGTYVIDYAAYTGAPCAETGIFCDNKVNTITADALETMVLTV